MLFDEIEESVTQYLKGDIPQFKRHLIKCNNLELIKTLKVWRNETCIYFRILLNKTEYLLEAR